MDRNWENVFERWSKGPSTTESERAKNSVRQIKEAISASSKLHQRNINVFSQGSYRNRVNVIKDSDVDIGVVCYDTFFPDYKDDNVKSRISKSFEDSEYQYSTFKNELDEALVARFGRDSVSRGNKAINIKENSYRVDADVAAFFEHRRYTSESSYISGVEMRPDNHNPIRIRNWPEQHYENGVNKNTKTNRRYKRIVRIFKSLRNEMRDQDIQEAQNIPSFLIECLIWNVPNQYFNSFSYYDCLRECIIYLYNNTKTTDKCNEWGEVSELKYLFRGSQSWDRKDVNDFLVKAWNYVGYHND